MTVQHGAPSASTALLLDLDQYAEVAAHLRHFPRQDADEVRSRLGITREAWSGTHEKWTRARATELACGKTLITTRFGRVFATTLQRLVEGDASLASLGPQRSPVESAPTPANNGAKEAGAPVPSDSAPLHIPSAPGFVVAPAQAVVPRSEAFASTAPACEARSGDALPFVLPGSSSPEAAFRRALEHAQAVQGPRPAPAVARGGTVAAVGGDRSLEGTVVLDGAQPGGSAGGFVAESRATPSSAVATTQVSVVEYAALRVELRLFPARATTAFARYRLTEAVQPAMDAYFRAQFEADPPLRMEFARAYAHYVAWFQKHS